MTARRLTASAALVAILAANPLIAQQPPPAPPVAAGEAAARLKPGTRTDLTCAAAFAIVASEQQRGVRSALAFPALGVRGKEFFVRTGAQAMNEAGLSREAVRTLFEAEVAKLQGQAAQGGSPDAALAAVMPGCLARLDASVARLEKPTQTQCAAIMQLAYEEVHAGEGLSARARDLRTLASVLEAREREALTAKGMSGAAADKTMIENHDRMRAEADRDGLGVEKYDLQVCYEFARPKKQGHF